MCKKERNKKNTITAGPWMIVNWNPKKRRHNKTLSYMALKGTDFKNTQF